MLIIISPIAIQAALCRYTVLLANDNDVALLGLDARERYLFVLYVKMWFATSPFLTKVSRVPKRSSMMAFPIKTDTSLRALNFISLLMSTAKYVVFAAPDQEERQEREKFQDHWRWNGHSTCYFAIQPRQGLCGQLHWISWQSQWSERNAAIFLKTLSFFSSMGYVLFPSMLFSVRFKQRLFPTQLPKLFQS